MSLRRIRAVALKEMREYRRNRFIVGTMTAMPFVFLIAPTLTLFRIPASAASDLVRHQVGATSLLLLIVPAVIPPVISSYSVIGERDQGTLEPVLTSPIRRDELLLGKAVGAFLPSVGIAYVIYAIFVGAVRLGATPAVSAAVWHAPQVVAQLLFTPLLATWAVWVGIAVSSRSSDVRVAQQLATLGSLPALGFTALISFQVLTPSILLAVGLALALLAADVVAWRFVSRLFDRERLLTGARARSATTTAG
jgi:ABC-type transport system involved in multi-copper enzyme maturation permease subunit